MDDATLTIDDFGPLPVRRPASMGELGAIVDEAGPTGQGLYPVGGRTMLGLGNAPTKPGIALDVRGLADVIDFPARDMTITVQAGIALGRLMELLAKENLRLPIDVPRAAEATLGGVIAANVNGSRRFGYGTMRDYVIGIAAVNDEGREFKAGGRVVKNVAGYDLCKLLVGSLGTLGIVTQVTLKLRPLAEEKALVCVPVTGARLAELLDKLMASRTRPVILDAVNQATALTGLPAGEWVMIVAYEGNADAVKWQVQQLVKELGAQFPVEARLGYTSQPLDAALAEWPLSPGGVLTLKASLLPSRVAEFLLSIGATSSVQLRAHAGNGIVMGHYADVGSTQAGEWVRRWREAAAGPVVVTRAPAAWKRDFDVWGPPPPSLALMRQVRERFDPRGIFNPGRFLTS
jgi:glycolate oxidase FAD binding subunit